MNPRVIRIARWVAYPAFYVFALAVFGYLTFPYDQLKDRLISEFDRMQQKSRRRPGEAPMRLEIAELDGYWLTGVEVTGARLIIPPSNKRSRMGGGMGMLGGASKKDDKPEKPSVLAIDEASVRVRILPLLIGDVMVNFDVEAFGGEIGGSMPIGSDGDVEAEIEGVQLSELPPLRALLEGLPVMGVLNGELLLSPKEEKFAKADGKLEFHIDDVVIGDGKTEVMGVALPAAQIGSIVLEGTAQDGILTIDEMSARGRDLELSGEGKIKLHESWDRAQADIYIKFKFADSYRDKSDATKSLLGDSAGKIKPVVELDPRSPFRRAKTDDGYYRFHLSGPLGDLEPRPAGKEGASPGKRARTPRPTGRFPRLGGKLGGARRPATRDEGDGTSEAPEAPPRMPARPAAPEPPPREEAPTPEPERNPPAERGGAPEREDAVADDKGAEEQGEEDTGEE